MGKGMLRGWQGWEGGGWTGRRVTGKGRRRGKRRGDFTDIYDGMPGWT